MMEEMRRTLDHLPVAKRRELDRVLRILFDEFEDAVKGKLSPELKTGRILKVILFGSYARGDWAEDRKSGYLSDYDLLIVVNHDRLTDLHDFWERADEHLVRELTVTKHLETPVNFIVHSLQDVNDQLSRGRYFFADISRDAIALYETPGFPLSAAKPLSPAAAMAEARRYRNDWLPKAERFFELAREAVARGYKNEAAFLLHQAAERLYQCALLVLTLYSPKSHRLNVLRSHAESLDARLIPIWPRDTRFAKRSFERLRRAYVEARYSPEYTITAEELAWLGERIRLLHEAVATICAVHVDHTSDGNLDGVP